ncbi:MAG: hypothetical protein IIA78_03890 [Proteobacteria bacterium]|nr:hypothetical protein [Pseudomonadota bacterium]
MIGKIRWLNTANAGLTGLALGFAVSGVLAVALFPGVVSPACDAGFEHEVALTHPRPAPPVPTVNGEPVDTDCEDDEFSEVSSPVVIAWKPVKKTHSELGHPQNSGRIKIINYEVVVEAELEPRPGRPDGEEVGSILSVILPPDVTEMTIPDEFLAQAEEFKYEVLAREESWNQTAIESCFVLEE